MEVEREKNGSRHQDIRTMLLQAKEHQSLPTNPQKLGSRQGISSPSQPEKEATLPTPGSQISDLQNWKIINSCSSGAGSVGLHLCNSRKLSPWRRKSSGGGQEGRSSGRDGFRQKGDLPARQAL